MCWTVEFRDLVKRERILFETDRHVDYAWTLYELSTFPDRYKVVTASPLNVTREGVLIK